MTTTEQRLLDCHAAWVHGFLTTEELYQETWAAFPEPSDAELKMRRYARALGTAARLMTERRIVSALT